MKSFGEVLKLLLLLLSLLACQRGGCQKPDMKVEVGQLPPDPLEAARALGTAAVKEKDPKKLASLIAAFMARLNVPVVSLDGKGLRVRGPLANPPNRFFLWEPVLAGIARATTKGDVRPMTLVLRAFLPQDAIEKVVDADFTHTFGEAAKDIEAKKGTSADAMLVTAIAKDIELRVTKEADPRIDPTASLLIGIWVVLSADKLAVGGVPAAPPPAMPPGIPIPNMKHAMQAPAAPAVCSFMQGATDMARADKVPWGGGIGAWSSDNPIFGKLTEIGTAAARVPALPQAVTGSVGGMGIAAYVDVDGEATPIKVKYGDGPVTYQVKVVSRSPFNKEQLDAYVNCLGASNPGSAASVDALRGLPPAGALAGASVVWENTSVLDKHGTFTPDNAAAAQAVTDQVVKAGVGARGGSATGSSGSASAKFQVKPAVAGPTKPQTFTINALVLPFPSKPGVAFSNSSLLANRSVPLKIEIEAPEKRDWVLNYKEKLFAGAQGIGGGWTVEFEATVPFSLGANQDFSATGPGTWSFGFSGSNAEGTCVAPAKKHSFSLSVSGKVNDPASMMTHFNLKDDVQTGVSTTLTCTVRGFSMNFPVQGPKKSSVIAGSAAQSFDMPLVDGATKTFPMSVEEAKGDATVKLTAK